MLFGNQLEREMIKSGIIKEKKVKKKKHKSKAFNCKKCGKPMIRIENTNAMACSECKNFFIFDSIV